MPKIFRAMRAAGDVPALGDNDLGVRVPTDIEPDAQGNVSPGTGGMSVSPSLRLLPPHRVPRRYNAIIPDATGSNTFRVWSMGDGAFVAETVNENLTLRLDPDNPAEHGFVEPARKMGVEDYKDAIQATRPLWRLDEAGE